jgi:hypothetical protein
LELWLSALRSFSTKRISSHCWNDHRRLSIWVVVGIVILAKTKNDECKALFNTTLAAVILSIFLNMGCMCSRYGMTTQNNGSGIQ